MRMFKDESAENPLEVGFYVLIAILTMAFLMLGVGAFIDEFDTVISGIDITLSSWGNGVLATYMGYITWIYTIPSIFIAITMIWGVRAVIRKHTYTTGNNQSYLNADEEF